LYAWNAYIPGSDAGMITQVSDVENIGQCGRLSQLRWLLGAL